MSEEFNKEFMKLSEKDQKSILNLIQLKNMNKQTEYKKRIDKAIEFIKNNTKVIPFGEFGEGGGLVLTDYDIPKLLKILKGEDD